MVRIRLLAQANVGGETRYRGDECDVPADVATSLVTLSRAVLVRGEQPETPEGRGQIEQAVQRQPRLDGKPTSARQPERRQRGV